MKQLLAAATAAAGLAIGLTVATGPAQAVVRPHTATPTITVSPAVGLKDGTTEVTVTGTGFPADSVVGIGECNSDGATGTNYLGESCDDTNFSLGHYVDSSGDFKAKDVKVVSGPVSGEEGCPQTSAQAHVGVYCIIAASTTSGPSAAAFTPIFFGLPPIKTTTAKYKKIKGKETYKLTLLTSSAYEPVSKGSTTNYGGFEVIGTYVKGGKTIIGGCQGTTSKSGVVWGVNGLVACTGSVGEKIKVLLNEKLVGTLTARTATGVAGDIDHTFTGLKAGTYKIVLEAESSGQKVKITKKIG